jgi:glycosyltransferase involved in cell wall biosynthesis
VRLALVVHRFPERSERFLVDHARGLLGRGLDVHVVAGEVDRPALAEVAPDLTGRVHVMPAGARRRAVVGLRALAEAVRAPGRVGRHLWRSRSQPHWLAALARDLPLVRLRPDVVHTEFATLAVDRAHLPAVLGCRLTTSVRGYDVAYAGLEQPGYYDRLWADLSAIHVLGQDLWQRTVERGCPPDLPHLTIPPAVDAGAVPTASPGDGGVPLRLVSVGRLHWKKGHHHVLAALRLVRDAGVDAQLEIVGDGPELEALAFARHQLGLDDQVTLTGGLDREAAWATLATGHVFVHGAVTEGFGNAVLEAQAAALPVVCTDAEGLAENIAPGVTGVLVPRRDPAALAAAIVELAGDPERRVALGAAGRRRVLEHFRPEDQLDAFEAFFRDVVG